MIARIVGPEAFELRYAVGGGLCGGHNSIKSQEHSGYHYISFPYGFPVGRLKYTKVWIHNPEPPTAVNTSATTFTIEGELYDQDSCEDLDAIKNLFVLLPDNVIAFTKYGCGKLFLRNV